MSEIAEFLRARYAERRALAEAASPWPWKINPHDAEEVLAGDEQVVAGVFALSGNQTRNTATFIAVNDPAGAIADLDAKLALLDDMLAEQHDANHEDAWYSCATVTDGGGACLDERRAGGPCDCGRDNRVDRQLVILAQPFAEHPEFKVDAWRRES